VVVENERVDFHEGVDNLAQGGVVVKNYEFILAVR
jgi:hypothetical protein